MQLIIPIDEIRWDRLRDFIFIVLAVVIFCFLLVYNLKLRKKKKLPVNFDHKIFTIMLIIGINVLVFIYATTVYNDFLYSFDIREDTIVNEEILLGEAECFRHSCEIYDEYGEKYIIRNYDYKILEYIDIYEEIEKNYLYKSCVIEYFERSKRVISITRVE